MAALCHRQAFSGSVRPSTACRPQQVQRARLHVCASFRNKENIDLSKVATYKTHDGDTGSTKVQIARLSARVQQMSSHLQANRKDMASKRSLEAVLNQRRKLLMYLHRTDRPAYDQLIQQLGIRSVIAAETGGRRAYPTPNK